MDMDSPMDAELGAAVGRSLLDALECPVCLERMMPPITMCTSGHNVCHACRPRLTSCPTCRQPLLGTRNVALEQLARELPLGEGEEARPEQPEHLFLPSAPPPEVVYGCPLRCSWVGGHADIREHVDDNHRDKVLHGTRQDSCRWSLPLIVKDTRVMLAFRQVFLYHQRLHTTKKLFYIAVKFLGPQAEAENYKYEVELSTGDGEKKIMVMGTSTLPEHEDFDAVFESGKCITLDYYLVRDVAHGKQHSFSVIVSKRG